MNLALVLAAALFAQTPAPEAPDAGGAAPETTDAGAAQVPPDAGAPAPAPDPLTQQLDAVLAAPSSPAAPPAQASLPSRVIAGLSALNPALSVIFDGVAGFGSALPFYPSGDDPDLGGDATHAPAGVTLQELEIAFSAEVDPYLSAAVYLAIPNLEGLEIEEAYAQTLGLPWGLQLKGGVLRSAVGRQGEQHLHVQDFSRRPLINAAYLGTDGLRGPAVQLSWLAPTPFFLRVAAEALSLERSEDLTFGGAERTDPTFAATVETFLPATEDFSVLLGLSGAAGHAALAGNSLVDNGPRSWLFGADLTLKWKRPNVVASYFAVAVQAEYFFRRTAGGSAALPEAVLDGGLYAQVVAQLSRRWHAGFRYDLLGAPSSVLQPRADRVTAMVAFTPSEFSRVRLQGSRQSVPSADADWEALLLLEFSMGAHGAHAF